ncbi:MAG: fluoride efflux transporter CrcB [Gammaproteobacteria bacterium]
MMQILLVGVGGFAGSIARFLVGGWVQQWIGRSDFPLGTLAVNVIGCLLIGSLAQLADSRAAFGAEARALVFVGLLGGFTTFSSFGNETVNLWRNGEAGFALANIGANVVLCLAAVWLGRTLALALCK